MVFMATISLNVKRKSSYIGMVMPYKIMINGIERGRVNNGCECNIDIPSEQCVLGVALVGNSFTFHKMAKEIVLFPQNNKSGIIKCEIVTSPNLVGIFTLGIFGAIGSLQLKITY